MTRCDDELQRLVKVLEESALTPLKVEWIVPQPGDDFAPYGLVDLRSLVSILTRWQDVGQEWGNLMRGADQQLTRLTRERDAARAALERPDGE